LASTNSRLVDRRVQRTRRALRDAFHALMAERGWDDVSVQSICERADIGRSTFYLHYDSKEQLLEGGLDDLRQTLRCSASQDKRGQPNALPFLRGLIEHAHEQRKLFRALIGRRSGHVVRMRFRDMVLGLVREDLDRLAASWRRDAAAHCLTGAVVELLAWMAETRHPVRVDEVEHQFRCSIRPVITGLEKVKH
jgi:AcrR family transcriptional regulator